MLEYCIPSCTADKLIACVLAMQHTDGAKAIQQVLGIMLGPDAAKLQVNEQLQLRSGCQPAAEKDLEVVLEHPTSQADNYILHFAEAAVLAFCWLRGFFAEDCQPSIYSKLRASMQLPATEPCADWSDVDDLLAAIDDFKWKPGLLLPSAITLCFPPESAGTLATWQHNCNCTGIKYAEIILGSINLHPTSIAVARIVELGTNIDLASTQLG